MNYHISFDLELKKNPYPGLYIGIEGIDGCGKTTQREKLKVLFEAKNQPVVTTSEPNITLLGGDIIMDVFQAKLRIPPIAFQHLLTANRLVNLEQITYPALEKGTMVITDRCFWSAIVYGTLDQGIAYTDEAADQMLVSQSILSHYHRSVTPDIVFYLDISPDTAMKRIRDRVNRENDIYEKEEKLKKVVTGYRWLTEHFPKEFICINGEKPIEEITKTMVAEITAFAEKSHNA